MVARNRRWRLELRKLDGNVYLSHTSYFILDRPDVKIYPHLLACAHCDSVYRRRELAHGEVAHCARCTSVLVRGATPNPDRWLALTVTAAVAWLLVMTCPIVRVEIAGLHNEVYLWQALTSLDLGPMAGIMVIAGLVVVGIPAMQIGLMTWLLRFARRGLQAPGFARIIRLLVAIRPWSMVEVSMVGALVTIVKLSAYLTIELLPGMWALAALMLLLTLICRRDPRLLWHLDLAPDPCRES